MFVLILPFYFFFLFLDLFSASRSQKHSRVHTHFLKRIASKAHVERHSGGARGAFCGVHSEPKSKAHNGKRRHNFQIFVFRTDLWSFWSFLLKTNERSTEGYYGGERIGRSYQHLALSVWRVYLYLQVTATYCFMLRFRRKR